MVMDDIVHTTSNLLPIIHYNSPTGTWICKRLKKALILVAISEISKVGIKGQDKTGHVFFFDFLPVYLFSIIIIILSKVYAHFEIEISAEQSWLAIKSKFLLNPGGY